MGYWRWIWREGSEAKGKAIMVVSRNGRLKVYMERGWASGNRSPMGFQLFSDAKRTGEKPTLTFKRYGNRPTDFGDAPGYAKKGWGPVRWQKVVEGNAISWSSVWWRVDVHHWLLAVVTAIGPGMRSVGWWKRRRSRKWVREGRCGECGYDLSQSPQRRPECGAVS